MSLAMLLVRCTLALIVSILIATVSGRGRDKCAIQPTINGLCVTSTLGIYYDAETQHCKYMGCSPDKKLFATLEDCERICNNNRHRKRRLNNANKQKVFQLNE